MNKEGDHMMKMTILLGLIRRASLARLTSLVLAGATAFLVIGIALPASASGPNPGPGFWSGTDTNYMTVGGKGPYTEPVIGGSYAGYIGMIGNWASWKHCSGDKYIWSKTNAAQARTDYVTYHKGIGDGAYWFMAGPGVDPNYNGTVAEATAWGAAQAARTLSDLATLSPAVTYPVVIMDVELPGNAPGYTPAPDNGWNDVYTSDCSGVVKTQGISAQLDRADFDGFANYLTSHSSYKAGVYSAPSVWADIFGTGSYASLTNTYEWTYTANSSSLSDPPYDWCLAGTSTCAQFFGGISSSSKYALMWQWSGGGGAYNGVGDFDQIYKPNTP
jgi:hypothetical protein